MDRSEARRRLEESTEFVLQDGRLHMRDARLLEILLTQELEMVRGAVSKRRHRPVEVASRRAA